ncbi:MAG: tetratricopeptide repeat protein [Candidatus Aminicenantes bacterium]|nr:MAG: tetratricopeptide repeat protein [Candidatus Aminicenantes bacterium]
MNKKKEFLLCCLIIVSLLTSSLLFPQAGRGRGRLSGKVTDESGNPVTSATITLEFFEKEEVTRETKTDKNGKWKIAGLGSGRWKIAVSAQGFIPYQKTVSVSQLERNPSLNIILNKMEEQLIEETPGITLFEKGNELFNEKKFEEAIANYQEFLEKNPELYEVHFSLGNCYKEMGDIEQALKEFQLFLEKAIEENEKDRKIKAKTLAAIGECHLKKEDLNSAQNYFKKSLALDPRDEILAYNVGEIYFAHQKLDEAIEYYEFATQIKLDWSDPYYKLGLVFLNKTDYEKAKESLQKFLELEPDTERSANVRNILDYIEKM